MYGLNPLKVVSLHERFSEEFPVKKTLYEESVCNSYSCVVRSFDCFVDIVAQIYTCNIIIFCKIILATHYYIAN